MDLGRGPHLHRGVRAGSLRALEPIVGEKTRGRREKNARAKKYIRSIYIAKSGLWRNNLIELEQARPLV